MKMIKICMLTSTHDPLDGRIFQKESKSLSKYFDVAIVAPGNVSALKVVDGVYVYTVRKPKSKLLHFFTLWRIFTKGLRLNCNILHCHEPDSLFVGLIIKFIKRNTKVIYDVHEHWPSEIAYGWLRIRNKKLLKLVETMAYGVELILAQRADRIIVVSKSVGERFTGKIAESRISVIPNAPLLRFISIQAQEKDADMVIVGGGLQSYHGIYELLQALADIKKYYPNIRLKIIGKLREKLELIIKQYNLEDNIILTGYLPYEKMYEEIIKGKIGVVLYKPEYYNAYISLPNKLFDYMICGLPVIASNLPEIRSIIKNAECGLLVNPIKLNEIRDALLYLLRHEREAKEMGIHGKQFIEHMFNWNRFERIFLKIYEEII